MLFFTAARNLGDGMEMLLARFCIKCGLRILAKKFPAVRLTRPASPLASEAAASVCTFSEITVLKAEVLVST